MNRTSTRARLAIPCLAALAAVSFGQPAELPEAQLFAPGVISKPDRHEFGSVLSRDGHELYFGVDIGGRSEIWRAVRGENGWTQPEAFLADEEHSFNDPFLDPAEQRLYFISTRPNPNRQDRGDTDIWFLERTDDGWSEPVPLGPTINSPANEYYVSFTEDGTLYFASNVAASPDHPGDFDIYAAAPDADAFGPARRLGPAINTRAYEADVFVAPDESYLIFAATRREGFGRGDLYVSFKGESGNWRPAVNMGERVNTAGHELCPFVTRDGTRLLFTSNQDIYEIDASILESFRP